MASGSAPNGNAGGGSMYGGQQGGGYGQSNGGNNANNGGYGGGGYGRPVYGQPQGQAPAQPSNRGTQNQPCWHYSDPFEACFVVLWNALTNFIFIIFILFFFIFNAEAAEVTIFEAFPALKQSTDLEVFPSSLSHQMRIESSVL